MNRFALTSIAAVLLSSVIGCAGVEPTRATVSSQEVARSGDYCHKKVQMETRTRDVTDYYGPCDGPSLSDQIQREERFESFRFGRDYMDEG